MPHTGRRLAAATAAPRTGVPLRLGVGVLVNCGSSLRFRLPPVLATPVNTGLLRPGAANTSFHFIDDLYTRQCITEFRVFFP